MVDPVVATLFGVAVAFTKTLLRSTNNNLGAEIVGDTAGPLAEISQLVLGRKGSKKQVERAINRDLATRMRNMHERCYREGIDPDRLANPCAEVEAVLDTIGDHKWMLGQAVHDPDALRTDFKERALKQRVQIDERLVPYFDELIKAVVEQYIAYAERSPNYLHVAAKQSLKNDKESREADTKILDAVGDVKHMVGKFASSDSKPSRVFFGSRPDVVAGERFVERDEQKHLHELIVDPTRRRTVLVGMRGCGKTQLAASLAEQCEEANWNLVAWINAVSRESIQSDLVELAKQLQIDTSDLDDQDKIVRRCLGHLRNAPAADRLIVFDNVENIDDLRGLLPSGKGLRIVATTTNNAGWEHHDWKTIKVGVFDRSESIDYLLTVTRCDDHDAADALAQRLGDLPLAIAQAAGTARHKDLSLARYLKRLDSRGEELDIHHNLGDEYTDDVATVLWMAVEAAVDSMKNGTKHMARRQLGALALLAESGVPTRWLDPTIEQQDDRELQGAHQADDEDAHDALTELIHRSIVQQSADKATTMLHRLQAQVLRESWTEKEHRQACESATNFLAAVNIETLPKNATDTLRRDTLDLIEQLRAVSAQKYSQCLLAESATQNCLFQAFEQAFELGVPQHAVNLSTAVSLFNSIENVEPSDALALQNQLGCAYEAAGDYDTAIRLHSEVLAAYEQMIDIDAGEILISRNNLATAYKANRNIPKAIEILEGTFKEAYQRYGLEHEQTIGSLNNLAETYTQVYEPDIILPMFIVAFELSKKILNPADDISLAIRNNLALTFLKMGDATKAISEFTSLLQDRQRFHLNRHVEHLITLRNLAEAHEANGDMEEAISTLKRAHAEGTELHGDHHLETLWTVNSLGCAYLQDNQFESARHEFESALAKCDEFLDYNHPLTTTIRTNLEYVEQLLATTSESGPTTRRHMD